MDLLVLSEVRWGYFRTRKQFLLSRFPAPWRVFFAQPPGGGADDPWEPKQEGRVTYFTVPFLKPGTKSALYNAAAATGPGRWLIESAAERYLGGMLRKLGVDREPVVLASNIYTAGALSRLRKKLLLYDFNDSPFQFSVSPPWARGYWPRTIRQADAVFVVSEFYRRQLAGETDRPLILLGNGVEMAHFEAPRDVPADLAPLPRPLIGYVGLLSHFLDFEMLESLRRNRRGGTLVLVGPGTPATDAAVAELGRREGVAVLGPRPYEQVPAYMQALDVGVIPFRADDPFVQGINPNKVYQYLAAGLPVLTTPLLDLRESAPDLLFATDDRSMSQALATALDAPADRDRRRALARPHDWDALAARMVHEIEARLPAA
ncbi:MAG: glycosyltransferase [Candidatus Eisenbacteria bacterium]|uniref:Glycosyltransferase n=1 Tax=Eiseniibacteriota bacterium TaxID=2212470 RepID=A0A933SFI8_UNCEI|nr:glycosyltransferase [Candidatus Eisenbacteria bacterium]